MGWIEANFWALYAFAVAWILAWALASVVVRRSQRKPIVAQAPKDALFVERWTSGRSVANAIARLGGARNCLMVAVKRKGGLIVQPHFPFSLFFMPEVFGVEGYPSRADIHDVKIRRGLFGRALVTVIFRDGPRSHGKLELRLREPGRFIEALKTAGITVAAED